MEYKQLHRNDGWNTSSYTEMTDGIQAATQKLRMEYKKLHRNDGWNTSSYTEMTDGIQAATQKLRMEYKQLHRNDGWNTSSYTEMLHPTFLIVIFGDIRCSKMYQTL